MAKITVKNTEVTVLQINNEDYISLTDMLKAKQGEFLVSSWLRNRNTLEYIGIWESVYNPNFNYIEFDIIKSKAGLNSFIISTKELIEKANIISLQAKTGRYGGTYAHKDIAFEFALWISPEFKIYIIKEFQRLKEDEQKLLGWSAKRELAKINYHIHTDAIKQNLIPQALTPLQISSDNITKEESHCYLDDDIRIEILKGKSFSECWRPPFYYEWTKGILKDNYEDIVKNIYRVFTNKALMREKVVNKEYCKS